MEKQSTEIIVYKKIPKHMYTLEAYLIYHEIKKEITKTHLRGFTIFV